MLAHWHRRRSARPALRRTLPSHGLDVRIPEYARGGMQPESLYVLMSD